MDKITKFLSRRTKKERLLLIKTIELLLKGKFDLFDIKKLKGQQNIFRLRIGKFRVIFEKSTQEVIIKSIQKRDSKTYSNI